ncbi:MAG: MFS transporter [Gammaproteobacteria bacterium]|nr:MFS transporter [Gammaproteobacteria bacterium]
MDPLALRAMMPTHDPSPFGRPARFAMRAEDSATVSLAPRWQRILVLLTAVNFLNYFDRSVFSVVLEPIRRDLRLDDATAGLLVGAFAILYAGVGIPLGWLADLYRRVTLLSIAIAFWSLMTALCGIARNATELVLARVGAGVGEAACFPISLSIVGNVFPAERRAAALAVFTSASFVGTVAGLITMGYLAEHFGWRLALLMVGLPGLLLAFVVWRFLPEPDRPTTASAPLGTAASGLTLRELLSYRAFGLWLLSLSFGSLAMNSTLLWGPAYSMRAFGLSLSETEKRSH